MEINALSPRVPGRTRSLVVLLSGLVILYKYVIVLGYALYEELFIICTYLNELFVKYLSMEIIAFYVNVENGMIEI